MDCCTPSRRAISASRTPAARHARARSQSCSVTVRGPAPRPDQPGGPVPLRPLVQRGHVVRRQPQRRRDLRTGEPDLPQRRHRDVPHGGVGVCEPEQRGLPGEDPRHPVRAQNPQVSSFWHALQDGRRCG